MMHMLASTRSRSRPAALLLAMICGGVATHAQAQEPSAFSRLWGRAGELWSADSRLPDFSHAGYHSGERPLPVAPRAASVKDFGALGDGAADDTQAFVKAVAAVERGAIEIPPGRYRITDILEITKPGIVLRGAGPDKTVLFFPTPLNDIRPNWGATTTGRRTSNYSWSGGFIWLKGDYRHTPLATIEDEARRGDTVLRVSSATRLQVGQRIEIRLTDTADNALARHLYSDDPGPMDNLKGRSTASLVCRITRIDGDRIRVDRPLRFDVRPAWQPQVRSFEPTVTESGVEHLTFEFPVTEYQGHFTELGFNPVALSNVAHCWVRNIRIVNADSGPFIRGHFNTVQDVVHESARKPDRGGHVGHHGISLGGGDNLLTGFDIRARLIHDISVSQTAGNVISRGRGVDLALDHHRRAPYENLFTDLDAGQGTRLWHSGGGAALGKHCGARGTFWNIRAARPLGYPPPAFGPPSLNLVGLHTDQPTTIQPDGKWFEAIAPAALHPQNLHQAQLTRRLGDASPGRH
jgi:hypothetical protein